MRWSNVRLILAREIRDQLRDRRTLFMIVVLPILLYPLLGMSFFQISQSMHEQATKVYVMGASPRLLLEPPLFENNRFASRLFSSPDKARLLDLEFAPEPLPGQTPGERAEYARQQVESELYDAAICFPPDFAEQLDRFRRASATQAAAHHEKHKSAGSLGEPVAPGVLPEIPRPEIIFTTASEQSQITFARLHAVLRRWSEELGKANLSAAGLPAVAARPFELDSADLADKAGNAGVVFWAKLLPVMLLLWALTGAFYPAVDLCAGEKERGTLETLLSSPAERSEIVVGKLVTIMLFSMITAILNLVSMGITGWLVLARLPNVGTPPWFSIVWLVVALVPISALFSALCLALAALARSTKEGQYYLMPLMLICLPLAVLPMAPGVELNMGNSLIPVTNVVLLLRTLLEGNYWEALRFAAPVVGMTLVCCLLAIRWAVDQFNQESVLFHESERLDLGLWARHLVRDRQPTPGVAMAMFCGLVILLVKFCLSVAAQSPALDDINTAYLVKSLLITQLAVVVTPTLLMAVMLTNNPLRTFLLDRQSWRLAPVAIPAAVVLAITLHPVVATLGVGVAKLYPIGENAEGMAGLIEKISDSWVLLLLAAVPAICEELAFRGFILSGLRHTGKKWRAIIVAAVFFGLTHFILQQQIVTAIVGVVIGYIAVQSGNLLPCIAYHFVHNALSFALAKIALLPPDTLKEWPLLDQMIARGGDLVYRWPVVIIGAVLSAMILTWFSRLPYRKTKEEELQEAIRRGIEAEDEPLASTIV